MIGSTSATASGWRWPATPARTPTGASAASTASTQANGRSCSCGDVPRASQIAQPGEAGIEERLHAEGEGQHGPGLEADMAGRQHGHDQRRPDRVPGVGEHEDGARGVDVTTHVRRQPPDQQTCRDEQRHQRRRSQDEHRHDHQLARHRVADPDFELDLLGDDEGGDQAERDERRQAALGRRQDGQRRNGGEQQRPERHLGAQLATRQRRGGTIRGAAEELLDVGVVVCDGHGAPPSSARARGRSTIVLDACSGPLGAGSCPLGGMPKPPVDAERRHGHHRGTCS